ncbi:glycerate kinase [Calidifontibacter terrae]
MRVLVAADAFASLPAAEAARVVCEAWRDTAAHVEICVSAQGSGRAGSAAALGEAVGAALTLVAGEQPLPAYVEGRARAFVDANAPGESVGAAARRLLDDGIDRVVLALGDCPQIDGGQAFLRGFQGTDDPAAVHSTEHLVGLAETDRVLLGFQGAAYAAVDEQGLDKQAAQDLERQMGQWVDLVRAAHPDRKDLMTGAALRAERQPGAGAGGGLGYLLLATGGQVVPAPTYSAALTGLPDRVAAADLVVTTATVFDWRLLDHSVLHTATSLANADATPVVALVDEVHVGRREQMSLGLQGTYSVQRSGWIRSEPADAAQARTELERLTRRVANTWTPSPRGDVR